jgi:CRP-like cAMP-binding protein
MFSEKPQKSCKDCVSAWKNFRNLSDEEIQRIDANRYEASFKPGEIIIKQGSPVNSAVFLASGITKIYVEGVEGRNFILGIGMPGNMIVGPGVHITKRHSYSVAALTAVQACFINFDIISNLIEGNSSFALGMLEDISSKSINAQAKMISLAQKKMPGRIAEALLYFSDNVFNTSEFDILLSRQEIGEMTNMAKESVVRILKDLESEKIIETSCSKIKITDIERLRRISESGDLVK